jgi:hypothetical protein
VTTGEAAASKAHVDPRVLEQARADLGVVTSRGNAGGVMAVQWRLARPSCRSRVLRLRLASNGYKLTVRDGCIACRPSALVGQNELIA